MIQGLLKCSIIPGRLRFTVTNCSLIQHNHQFRHMVNDVGKVTQINLTFFFTNWRQIIFLRPFSNDVLWRLYDNFSPSACRRFYSRLKSVRVYIACIHKRLHDCWKKNLKWHGDWWKRGDLALKETFPYICNLYPLNRWAVEDEAYEWEAFWWTAIKSVKKNVRNLFAAKELLK